MNRREFLKSLLAVGASISIPIDLATASSVEVDAAWKSAIDAWGLFEVNDYGTLSYANFEEPTTRREAYYLRLSDFDAGEIERHWSLNERIKDRYRDALVHVAEIDQSIDEPDYDAIDERVEEEWPNWIATATGDDRSAIDEEIEQWLDAAPDWCNECDELYKTGNAQGAAYDHFLSERVEVMEALSIVIIEGDCPGSSYFAAELHIPAEEANQIAESRGWKIRFV